MANTVKSVKNSVKRSALEVEGKLRAQVGKGAYKLPGTVRMLETANYVFLTVPMSTGIYKITNRGLEQLADDAPAPADMLAEFRAATRTAPRVKKAVEVPAELLAALKKVPQGYKLVMKGGEPALVKARTPRKK